jgi:hypothetical protein
LAHSIVGLFRVHSPRRVGFTMPKGPLLLLPVFHLPFAGFTMGLFGYRSGSRDKSPLYFTPVGIFLLLLLASHDEDTEVGF